MRIDPKMTDEVLLRLVGERLSDCRLARNLTQQQLAEQAGLGLRTVQRLELGAAATQLSGFIRVCRVLGLVENLEAFIPQPDGATPAGGPEAPAGDGQESGDGRVKKMDVG